MDKISRLDLPDENDSIKANRDAIQICMPSGRNTSRNVDDFEHFASV
jgi:hypothetical protein